MKSRWPIHVLVIEDDVQVRSILRRALTMMTDQVTCVEDGTEGIELVPQHQFGLIITDLKMAGIDGLEVARRVRSLRPGLPVVITTGFATQTEREAIEVAGWGFLAKPFNVSELRTAVARAMGDHRS